MILRSQLKSTREGSNRSSKPAGKRMKKKRNSKDASAHKFNIVDMPVDVLFEIFKLLELVNLMHLSRTSKALRSILMSHASIFVWKQAVANDGLPPCTTDLNEPQLAELIFGESCDWCEQNVSDQKIIWAARTRACTPCIRSKFTHLRHDPSYPLTWNLLPSIAVDGIRYIEPDFDQKWRRKYAMKRTEDQRLKWLEVRMAERRVISEHADACHKWFKPYFETQVKQRKAIIIERLKKRGWKEELDKLSPGSWPTNKLAEVGKACKSELTESILAALDDVLDEFMEEAKTARLVREKETFLEQMLRRLREFFGEYSHTLPANHILPNTADIYFHPTVNAALSVVESPEALEEALTRIRPLLPGIVDDCLKVSKQHLAKLVIDDYIKNNKTFDLSVLTLASTLFRCIACRRDLTLDQTVAHGCQSYGYSPLFGDARVVYRAIGEVTTAHKIHGTFSFSLARLEPFRSVLLSCGIDPNTTTVTNISEIDPIVECLGCFHSQRGRLTMQWLSVAKHFQRSARYRHSTSNVSVLDEPEAEIVRARMLEQYQKDTATSKDHICIHCRDRGGSMTLLGHVKRDHHINSPVYGQDVIVSTVCASAFRKKFYLWPPKV